MKMKRAWIILITVISALLLITGCDSRTGSEIKYKVTSINVSPRELYNDLNNQTYSTVAVTVEDNAGYPAVGVAVTFSANIGYIQGKVLTDEQGIATTNFNDDGRVGYATITAAVEGSTMIDSVNVMDSPTYDLQIKSVSEEIIYIDGGITTSTIEVQVKDQDGFAVTGEDVFFQASLGYIEYNVKTDSSGIAQTQLRDDGNILNVGTSVIHAYCGEAVADTTVSILAPPPVTNLELNIDVDPDLK